MELTSSSFAVPSVLLEAETTQLIAASFRKRTQSALRLNVLMRMQQGALSMLTMQDKAEGFGN